MRISYMRIEIAGKWQCVATSVIQIIPVPLLGVYSLHGGCQDMHTLGITTE